MRDLERFVAMITFAVVCSISLSAGVCIADIFLVDDDAASGGDGLTWATAFCDLQSALGEAEADDVIWVAEGQYRPAGVGGDSAISFELVDGVSIYGGFSGAEDPATFDVDDRDWAAHQTILSGDLDGDDGPGFDGNEENSYHVIKSIGCGSSTLLDGLTIIGGNADGLWSEGENDGGGLYVDGGSMVVRNCRFERNSAVGQNGHGGAIYCKNGGSPLIADSVLIGNRGKYGGAVFADGSDPVFERCRILGNWADDRYGGAVFANLGSDPVFSDCLISGNAARSGGAMYANDFSHPSFNRCTIVGNTAYVDCGGISAWYLSGLTLDSCILWANEDSGPSGEQAQILLDSSTATVDYSSVEGWTGAIGGVGSDGSDPLFDGGEGLDGVYGTEDDDPRPTPGSNSINGGDPMFVMVGLQLDLDGRTRVLCDVVDRGAFEFGLGDYDCNQSVDLDDFSSWLGCMTGPGGGPYGAGCESLDMDYDLDVDLDDFASFQLLLAS